MQALSEKTFQPTDLHHMILDAMIEQLFNNYNDTPMQQFFIPVKPKQVPDTHHMVDNYNDAEEFENRSEEYDHEALMIDAAAELALMETENN